MQKTAQAPQPSGEGFHCDTPGGSPAAGPHCRTHVHGDTHRALINTAACPSVHPFVLPVECQSRVFLGELTEELCSCFQRAAGRPCGQKQEWTGQSRKSLLLLLLLPGLLGLVPPQQQTGDTGQGGGAPLQHRLPSVSSKHSLYVQSALGKTLLDLNNVRHKLSFQHCSSCDRKSCDQTSGTCWSLAIRVSSSSTMSLLS